MDDYPINGNTIEKALSKTQDINLIRYVKSGAEAIEFFTKIRPDVAVIDVLMPEMNGFELAQILLSSHPDLRILFFSGMYSQTYIDHARRIGAVGWVVKESTADLIKAIRTVFDGGSFFAPNPNQPLIAPPVVSAPCVKREGKGALTDRETEILRLWTQGFVGGLILSSYSGTLLFPGYDGSGNVVALVKSDGSVGATYEYGPFGEPIRVHGLYAKTNPIRFSSKYTDEDTGLIYYGRRYYSSTLGRWLGRDPKMEQASLNLYVFCHNGGINLFDPDGCSDMTQMLSTTAIAGGLFGFVMVFVGSAMNDVTKGNSIDWVAATGWGIFGGIGGMMTGGISDFCAGATLADTMFINAWAGGMMGSMAGLGVGLAQNVRDGYIARKNQIADNVVLSAGQIDLAVWLYDDTE